MEVKNLQDKALFVRKRIIELGKLVGNNGAHFGSSLSLTDLLVAIYGTVFENKLHLKNDPDRDRFILSKGHGALGYYCVLEAFGYLTNDQTNSFEQNGSDFFAHAHKELNNGIEYSGGSLGLGLPFATGIALANKVRKISSNIYVLVGDGECDEGIIWESLMSISNFNLSNITILVDKNKMQSDGEKVNIMNQKDLGKKFKSFGFDVTEIDGHNFKDILKALNKKSQQPKALIANTIKGKGVDFMESNSDWHHGILNEKLYDDAISSLDRNYGWYK